MPSKIYDKITEEIKAATLAKDTVKLATLRMIKAEVLKIETATAKDMDEAGFVQVIKAMKKQREEAIEEFRKANRADLAEKEAKELAILVSYLPKELSKEELEKIVDETIAELQAKDMKAMGKVIKAALAKCQGAADGKIVSEIVKTKLSQ